MAIYTYIGNLNLGETTSRLILRGGDLVVNKNEYADFTVNEYNQLSGRYQLVAGQALGSHAAGVDNTPGLYDILSPAAVDELLSLVGGGSPVSLTNVIAARKSADVTQVA